jgi:hypothetical protein
LSICLFSVQQSEKSMFVLHIIAFRIWISVRSSFRGISRENRVDRSWLFSTTRANICLWSGKITFRKRNLVLGSLDKIRIMPSADGNLWRIYQNSQTVPITPMLAEFSSNNEDLKDCRNSRKNAVTFR